MEYMLNVIQQAADGGDLDAAAWLRGEGWIKICRGYPQHKAVFCRFNNQSDRYSKAAKEWTNQVLSRDSFQCAECQSKQRLQAHHIKSWAEFPDLRFDIDNGQTLCRSCHAGKHPQYANVILRSRFLTQRRKRK